MKTNNETAIFEQMRTWRQELHRHPEFGFEERRTASLVADELRRLGLDDVQEGIGGTGVVGTLRRGQGNRTIALRADMDALRITERGGHDHVSLNEGLMHACGHDGHTAMLLGAARMLAEDGGFDGTVRFIFQPAEEWGRGALAMLEDGLMTRFPFDEIYGLHNMPGIPKGLIETRSGPMMSAEDIFEIRLEGVGGHAARPQAGSETMIAACALVLNMQTIVSRRLSPAETAVVSVTELLTDGTRNALPGHARILGDARSFRPEVGAEIERWMRKIAQSTAEAHGVTAEVSYTREFVPLINDAALTEAALDACAATFGAQRVRVAPEPMTASEDFAQFLRHVPGCFLFIGAGEEATPLHNPDYDFDDDLLLDGARLHASIVRHRLPVGKDGLDQ